MTVRELLDLVNRMRAAQMAYFATKDVGSLREAKKLEMQMDNFILTAMRKNG